MESAAWRPEIFARFERRPQGIVDSAVGGETPWCGYGADCSYEPTGTRWNGLARTDSFSRVHRWGREGVGARTSLALASCVRAPAFLLSHQTGVRIPVALPAFRLRPPHCSTIRDSRA